MRPHRRTWRRAAVPLGVAAGFALSSGCGDTGGLHSAGPTPTAIGPTRLWPRLPPASAAPYDYGEGETARIPGIVVPDGDVRRLDPVAVVRAGIRARTNRTSSTADLPADVVRRIEACPAEPASCPVLPPHFRDLTGDGREEMVLGIELPGRQVSIRVYMPDSGGLTRILSTSDAVISVELAGRDLIVRVLSAITGYEYRTAWSWDAGQRAMLPARDEILRMPPSRAPQPSLTTSRPAVPPPATSPGVLAERR
ncbi:hypothetical protein [Streptomyces sp. ML-6]|uniref:hypothetical protein n=1 Tax=Streptomyces sp. ML-6 TaxID=2982693 RepID=UPI0024C008CF|nr:hypothetical protein [Streptomyces sp. ML-6]MDK0522222.1 hypothetical protein [Streptomyces sp. ML-6]